MACARMSLKGLLPLVRNVWLLSSHDGQRAWERALACAVAGRATAIAPATTRAVTMASTRAARRMRDPFIFISLLRTLVSCRRRESDKTAIARDEGTEWQR